LVAPFVTQFMCLPFAVRVLKSPICLFFLVREGYCWTNIVSTLLLLGICSLNVLLAHYIPSVWSASEGFVFGTVYFLLFCDFQKSDNVLRYLIPLAASLRSSILMNVYVSKVLRSQRRYLVIFGLFC
jgi:hypothetical protein